jgi:hypothetical protein
MTQNNNHIKPNTQSCQTAVIASAIAVVKDLADKYEYKQDSNWFEYYDKDGCLCAFDEDQGTYCEDCSEERKEEILNDSKIEFPEGFDELIVSTESSKENEGFLNCDCCGEIIECAIIWNEQELENWTKLDSENWKRCKNEPYHYYQIYKILEGCWGATDEFSEECLIIAENVLKHWI